MVLQPVLYVLALLEVIWLNLVFLFAAVYGLKHCCHRLPYHGFVPSQVSKLQGF